jgi:hypothetical protein
MWTKFVQWLLFIQGDLPFVALGLINCAAVEVITSPQHPTITTKCILNDTWLCHCLFKVSPVVFYSAFMTSCDEWNHIFFLKFSELRKACNGS